MANERLTRTPTSTGNRKIFTWAGWVKRATPGTRTWIFNTRNQAGTGDFFAFDFLASGDNDVLRVNDSANTDDTNLKTTPSRRDPSSWMHLVLSIDTTKGIEQDRVNIYANGVQISDFTLSNYPTQNALMMVNSLNGMNIGTGINASGDPVFPFNGEMFDIFFVDGQSLTPDVFGFYKDGNGYISAGSTQATDFRPGQWVPKKPSVIKNTINNNGGFGVNGFYLPMNDSSNFGADFHCDPNTIITLQDETAAQPKNGAPTTTDAYVSQLRSDPYAANLVLAVPGISTATGANLVTNGTFENGTTGWTINDATEGSMAVDEGQLVVSNTDTSDPPVYAYQLVTVEVGKRYTVGVDLVGGTASSIAYYLSYSNNPLASFASRPSNSGYGNRYISFTATSTTLYVILRVNANEIATAIFDNVVVKQEDVPIDYSADIKGSGTNKTLTAAGNAGVGYEIPSYYGSAMTFDGDDDYFTLPANTSDLLLGSSDFTIECWVNKTNSGQQDVCGLFQTANNRRSYLLLTTDTETVFYLNETGSSGINATANVVTPLNQWTHIAAERYGSNLTLYINGVAGAANTTANFTAYNNTVDSFMIGASDYSIANGSEFTGYIQDLRVYKGVAKYKGGFDVAKPYTPVGIATWRAVPDCTANNFATWNAVDIDGSLTDGNLKVSTGTSGSRTVGSTFGISSGKYYTEFYINSLTESTVFIGVVNTSASAENTNLRIYQYNDAVCYSSSDGNKIIDGTSSAYGATYTNGDLIGVSINLDTNEVTFFKNGTSQGTITTKTFTGHYEIMLGSGSSLGTQVVTANFGQNPTFSGQVSAGATERNTDSNGKGEFRYAPPSGFLALCEDNLPTPAIADPGEHFKTVLYTGDASNGRSITGVGFKPDLIWFKGRNAAVSHVFNDTVRGVTEHLSSNTTSAASIPGFPYLNSVDNDGFSLLGGTSSGGNISGRTYVAWCWKAGGAAVSNTDGTITSQVSANQDAGFSIVSYTGNATDSTVGHGLNKTPGFIIVKKRNGASDWPVYHHSLATQEYLVLNLTNAKNTTTELFYQDPTSSVFYIGDTSNAINASGGTYIAYCWAEIEGYSKFGSYTGNGDADGPFAYCGFKPAWVLIKKTDGSGNENWRLFDSSRCPTNQNNKHLLPSSSAAESTETGMDFLSNGFKLRDADAHQNQNGTTYIFMAFAESPFKTANAK